MNGNNSGKPREDSAVGEPESPIQKALDEFVIEIDGLAATFPATMIVTESMRKTAHETACAFVDKFGSVSGEAENGEGSVSFSVADASSFLPQLKQLEKVESASRIIPQTFVIAMVCQYDAFLSRLLKAFFIERPELVSSSEKKLTFREICEFESIENARDHILEKEVESIIRESNEKRFSRMMEVFSIKLREDLPVWPYFIELSERRNLFVHTGGAVSSQYLQVCDANGVDFSADVLGGRPDLGQTLTASKSYFRHSYRVLFEIAVKLTHVLWRKQFPGDREKADTSLTDIGYQALVFGDYPLACTIHDFAVRMLKKESLEGTRLRIMLNRAQAYKWRGDLETMNKILSDVDTTAAADVYKMVVAVLKDDFEKACKYMKRIGANGDVKKSEYRDWPVYKEFRESKEFLECYKEVFDEEFSKLVVPIKVDNIGKRQLIVDSVKLSRSDD
ncbi:hypothetical protein [Calycomorphotria hydatis]|uniref:Uncharacterized protein n=1 Tax=Calycomorphotria hydatis TaxID=2528027 RepID=A0A517TDD0_9PLAN|nr:hypothetical protein [Calycomorphotria hydatis]QDT66372.1 hypothetical protein V22_36380 [Calycomorphotria hydatis]